MRALTLLPGRGDLEEVIADKFIGHLGLLALTHFQDV